MTLYSLNGIRPDIDPGAWIAPNATLVGKVRLGPRASIWFGAVLRGDNEWLEIGAGSNVQDNAVIHSDPGFPLAVGEGCTIGHSAVVHGCTLGSGTLVGMGATILNGACLGRNCLIGAGALVTEGKEIPDRSLVVGAPGKVMRVLSDAQVEDLARTAKGYSERIAVYRDGLMPIDGRAEA